MAIDRKLFKATIFTCAAIALIAYTYGALTAQQSIPTTGQLTSIGLTLYSDPQLTQQITSYSWGTISPAETRTFTFYAKSNSNTNTILSMATANFQPQAAQHYFTVTWNRENTILQPNEAVSASVTLTVSPSVTGVSTFSVDIVITAQQVQSA